MALDTTPKPIWKDRIVTLASSGEYADFEIRLDDNVGTLIFQGRAYPRPGEAAIKTRINDVCAAYLRTRSPELRPFATFCVLAQPGYVERDWIIFAADWSYDHGRVLTPGALLNDPVIPEVDPRQLLLATVLPKSGGNPVTAAFSGGAAASQTIYETYDFAAGSGTAAASGAGGTAVIDMGDHPGATSVTLAGANSLSFPVRGRACNRYCVHYVNAFGGWDWLLLDGQENRSDALTRHTILTDYDNGNPSARGRRDWAVEVAPAWVLRTGILTDEQAGRMHHLLNSPDVYLQDLADGTMRPVVLTDTETQHKTYRSNGRSLVTYTFNAQLAQERFRR